MSKNCKIKVTSAFVYDGKIRVKGETISMPEAVANPILEREKAVLSNGGVDAEAKAPAKDTKAPAKAGAAKKQD